MASKTKEKKLTSRSSQRKLARDAEKREAERKYHEEVKPKILSENPKCERCHTAPSGEVHHKKGRLGKEEGIPLLIYEPYLVALCSPCHRHIESNRKESYENGWLIKRLSR